MNISEAENRPIWMGRIWNDFSIGAVYEKIGGFQDRLSDQHFVSQNISVFRSFPAGNFKAYRAADANRNPAAIRELPKRSMPNRQAKVRGDGGRNNGPCRPCVDQGINLACSYLVRFH
jgi:hypothetical protein